MSEVVNCDSVVVRTHYSREWNVLKSFVTDTWLVGVNGDNVSVVLVDDQYADHNLDWDFPPDAAKSLGESLIKHAINAKARKASRLLSELGIEPPAAEV